MSMWTDRAGRSRVEIGEYGFAVMVSVAGAVSVALFAIAVFSAVR
jgi:hypothetical protein